MSVFGVPLPSIPIGDLPSPRFIEQCFCFLIADRGTLTWEPTPSKAVERLRRRVDVGGILDPERDNLRPGVVLNLIRMFLSMIPNTIFGKDFMREAEKRLELAVLRQKVNDLEKWNRPLVSRVFGFFVLMVRENRMRFNDALTFLASTMERKVRENKAVRVVKVAKENLREILEHYTEMFTDEYSVFDESGKWKAEGKFRSDLTLKAGLFVDSHACPPITQGQPVMDGTHDKMCRNVGCSSIPEADELYQKLMTADQEEALKSPDNVTPL